MPTGDYADEAAFREQMGLSPYQGISDPFATAPALPARSSAYAPLLENVGSDTGVDPDYLARIMKIESGGDPNNRTGSYRGLFQLSPSEFTKYGGTGDIYDPEQNARAAANKTAAEARTFQDKYGRVPTSTDLYMTHQQGEGGYAQHIAAPDAPAWENMYATAEGRQKGPGWAKQAIWGNIPDSLKPRFGSVNNVTSQDLIDIYARKLGYGADRLPLAFGPTGSPAGLPEQADPNAPEGGSPAGNPMQADVLAQLEARAAGGGGATEFGGQRRMPPGQGAAPGPPPPGPPTGNLPFGIPGTFFNNPVQQALGDNFSTLLAFAGGARQGGIGQGLTQAAKASLIEGPENQKMKLLREQQLGVYQAIRAKGGSHADAMAAAMSPEVMKAITPELFGGPKVVEVGQDALGNKIMKLQHPGGRFTDIQVEGSGGAPGTSVSGSSSAGQIPTNYNEQGKDEAYLDAIRKQHGEEVAKSIKDITEGRIPAQGRNLQKLIPLAARYDQNFTGTQDYQTRLSTAKDFASGKASEALRRSNQAIVHADAVWNLIPKVAITDIGGATGGLINAIGGEYKSVTDKQYQSDRQEYTKLINALAGELRAAANSSGHGSLEEIRNWQQGSLAAASGPEMRGSVRGAMDFLSGVTESMARKKSEGLKSQFSADSLLSPKNAEIFQRIRSSAEGDQTAPTAPAAPTPAAAAPAQPGAALPAGIAPIAPPAAPAQGMRSIGHIYNTPRGPMIWRGKGWEPVSNANSL